MKKTILLVFILSSLNLRAQLTPPSDLQNYYSTVNFSLTGTAFFNDLAAETKAKHTNILYYSNRHSYLYDADEDPNNANNVLLIYSGESRDKREYLSGNNSHSSQTFNTEHVYPQSLYVGGDTVKGDLHHLRACDTQINSNRGSKTFASGSGDYGTIGSTYTYYPGDEWKGDVARMMLYLNLRYGESISDIGSLALFLQWNREDKVSAFEKNRNTKIAAAQGNRNPFIDNPYLVTVIWGGTAAENTWSSLSVNDQKFEKFSMYPNPVKGDDLFINYSQKSSIKIYNILGKIVLSSETSTTKNKIDVSSLQKGVYLIKLTSGTVTITKKIVRI